MTEKPDDKHNFKSKFLKRLRSDFKDMAGFGEEITPLNSQLNDADALRLAPIPFKYQLPIVVDIKQTKLCIEFYYISM